MESYKTQDYTDANDVLTKAEMNAIFEKNPDSKKEKGCFIGKHRKKIRVSVLVVVPVMPENKIYVSAEALFIPYNQRFSLPRTYCFCAFLDCVQKLSKKHYKRNPRSIKRRRKPVRY